MNIAICDVWRNPINRTAKIVITADDTPIGSIFASKGGIFSAITSSGYLVGIYPTLELAIAALPRGASS
jgi:hypothetical protein